MKPNKRFPTFSAPCAVTHGPREQLLANYFGIDAWSPDCRHLLALETDIGDFFVPEAYRVTYCRCDLHPRWRRDGRALAFNSVHEGSRQIYLVDAD